MTRSRRALLVVFAVLTWSLSQKAARAQVIFSDTFEDASATSWTMFEEIVGGNPCYAANIGSVKATPMGPAHQGSGALEVDADVALALKSNHVIAQRHVSAAGVSGRYRYEAWALIDPAAGPPDGGPDLHEGQTGPELSLQNTRAKPGGFATTTGGIQYVANRWSGQGTWNVWTDVGSATAGWSPFLQQVLSPGVWYDLVLDVDFDANRYIAFRVSGGGLNITVDLSGRTIVPEPKFTEEALWATLEAENAWSGCTQVFTYTTYYDDVSLRTLTTTPVPAASIAHDVALWIALAVVAWAQRRLWSRSLAHVFFRPLVITPRDVISWCRRRDFNS
jgi:hypothetical protein